MLWHEVLMRFFLRMKTKNTRNNVKSSSDFVKRVARKSHLVWILVASYAACNTSSTHTRKWCRCTHKLLVYVNWECYFECKHFRGFMMYVQDEFISLSNRNPCGIDILSGKHFTEIQPPIFRWIECCLHKFQEIFSEL